MDRRFPAGGRLEPAAASARSGTTTPLRVRISAAWAERGLSSFFGPDAVPDTVCELPRDAVSASSVSIVAASSL